MSVFNENNTFIPVYTKNQFPYTKANMNRIKERNK